MIYYVCYVKRVLYALKTQKVLNRLSWSFDAVNSLLQKNIVIFVSVFHRMSHQYNYGVQRSEPG